MSIDLRVAGLAPQDANRGIARLSQFVAEQLGVESGDVVGITGRRRTVAKVIPGLPDDPDEVIRIDGSTRTNADVGIDDRVSVEAVDVEPADRITVAFPPNVSLRGAEPYIHRVLYSRPILRGDTVRMALLGHPFAFVVTGTTPTGPVIVGEETAIDIRDRPLTEEDLRGEQVEAPTVTYEDVGGLGPELEGIREMIELPLRHPELFRKLGIAPPKGVLLHGPPGTGKTLIARAVANEVDATFVPLTGPEIMSKYYGESEQHLREIFDEAEANAPAIIFIDEIDSIAPKREEVTGEMERRIVAQLLALMDGLESRGEVIVIAATNRVNAIDPALRRGGRFDREIEIGVPDRDGRKEILQIHTRGMPLGEDVDLDDLADETYGFVGADLESLAKEAAMSALRRIREDIDLDAEVIPPDVLDRIQVMPGDFESARRTTEPSAMREVFVEVPKVTYDDVGGLADAKRELVRAVEWPLNYPKTFERLHTAPPKGILLYGPPGTGKTLLAKAVANASQVNFISVKGPELLDKYVGESERAVREVFHRARQAAPTIVFFDEIDSLVPMRGESFDSHVTERVVSQLLTELDGIEELEDVVVIGATNRPDIVDPALLRPGRLEKLVFVPAPDEDARREIFTVHTRGMPLADDVDLERLAGDTEGYAGSDIEAVCREASMLALDEFIESMGAEKSPEDIDETSGTITVDRSHFEAALETVKPSITPERREAYQEIAERLGGGMPVDLEESGIGFQ
ncbi:MAG TPA: CDC48 family AAA ATPase [Natrialbaceae archaeon]|nr:CDC48 family AAA ATPase [Natrialbaceae archaeon]